MTAIIDFIDGLLNRITMYRIVLYFLMIVLAVAAIFGFFGILPYAPTNILFSTFILLVVSWAVNGIFAKVFNAQANVESVYITALILALIITPSAPTSIAGISFLCWAAVWSMASKYIFAVHRKHIFNPAAFAVALTAIAINQSASWWACGNLPLLPFMLVGGLLITRKIQRFDLVLPFFGAALASIMLTSTSGDLWTLPGKVFIHTPLFFFAFIMLTEPLTTPPTRWLRVAYGAIVGALFAPAIHVGWLYSTPELALIAGNVFAYIVSPKIKYILTLAEKKQVGADVYDFVFRPDKPMKFFPGQYMEWTLAANDKSDGRGNRRYFTLASSPTESEVHLGVKFYEPSSSFKKDLLSLKPGDTIVAGQLAGDFTLPRDPAQKLVFIAGGIGITPFRSMVKYLVDRGDRREVTMLYSNRAVAEVAYREVFDEAAQKIGMRTLYAITDANETLPDEQCYRGRIDAKLIASAVPDYRERMFYISGTHAMVVMFKKSLHEMGIPPGRIKTDFFPGFA